MLATALHERREPTLSVRGIAATLSLTAVPVVLVLAQPDLGTVGVLVAVFATMVFLAGARVRHLLALALVSGVAVAAAWQLDLVADHQVERIGSFLDASTSDPLGAGYNTAQAQIAVGVGGLAGRAPEAGTQSALGFVPEHHTDFIFAVVGETYGFAGAALVLSLYALLIWRGLHILTIAKNLYGALLAGGITVMLLFQLFVNIGMNVGIMPITGVTAPLLSFGGSSLLSTFLALGLLHSVHAQARETAAGKGRASVFQ
jgi:rod shape determining protein RodA